MPPRSEPPAWLAKTAVALLFAAATGWASFVTTKAMYVKDVEARVEQYRQARDHQVEILNYKIDILLRAHGFDPAQLPVELQK